MTPGPIDLKIVRDRLLLVERSLDDLRSLPQADLEEFTSERRNVLAADAALTYAFEAAAETGRSDELVRRVGLQGELGVRLAGEATAGVRPGPTESP